MQWAAFSLKRAFGEKRKLYIILHPKIIIPTALLITAIGISVLIHILNSVELKEARPYLVRDGISVVTADDTYYMHPPMNWLEGKGWQNNAVGLQSYFQPAQKEKQKKQPGRYLDFCTITSTELHDFSLQPEPVCFSAHLGRKAVDGNPAPYWIYLSCIPVFIYTTRSMAPTEKTFSVDHRTILPGLCGLPGVVPEGD